jgi:S-DNA-T family DNA segregation ATPase FtsK/SpoIIIE
MNVSSSARYPRLTEAIGVLALIVGLSIWLCLVTYHADDPSWNTVLGAVHARNVIGPVGARLADLLFQIFGVLSFALPVVLVILAWNWVRSRPVAYPLGRALGYLLFVLSGCTAFELGPKWTLFGGAVHTGGTLGVVLADTAVSAFNVIGASLLTLACFLVSLYLASSFRISHLASVAALPALALRPVRSWWRARRAASPQSPKPPRRRPEPEVTAPPPEPAAETEPPFEPDIPIRPLDEAPPPPPPQPRPTATRPPTRPTSCLPPRSSTSRRAAPPTMKTS